MHIGVNRQPPASGTFGRAKIISGLKYILRKDEHPLSRQEDVRSKQGDYYEETFARLDRCLCFGRRGLG